MTTKEKIEKFISDNSISVSGQGSGLNANCTVLSGFSLYAGAKSPKIILDVLKDYFPKVEPKEYEKEFRRVFKFAKEKTYENYWFTKEALLMYKFDTK